MQIAQPRTPFEALEISAGLRTVLNTVSKSADLLKFWDKPYRGAATDFEEMTLLDKLYWAYKCQRPVLVPERGVEYLAAKRAAVPLRLPADFEKHGVLTLGAVGDLIQSEGLEHSQDVLYERVVDLIFANAIAYANLESPVTDQELKKEVISDKETPVECCSRRQFAVLKGHQERNFTVMHTAGNHTFDMGVEGLATTWEEFDAAGIADIGTNRDASQRGKGKILEKDGITLGFVSATYGLNGRKLPPDGGHLINAARLLPKRGVPDLSLLESQIAHCRAAGCDFIIASLHWGHEFEFFPRRRQVDIAHALVELGVDAVIAHHPHVVQPVEYYRTRRDPDRVAVIAYSLGSLVWGYSAPYLAMSAVLNLTLAKGMRRGRQLTYIESAAITPVFRDTTLREGKRQTRIEKLAEHLRAPAEPARREYLLAMQRYAELVFGAGIVADQSAGA